MVTVSLTQLQYAYISVQFLQGSYSSGCVSHRMAEISLLRQSLLTSGAVDGYLPFQNSIFGPINNDPSCCWALG